MSEHRASRGLDMVAENYLDKRSMRIFGLREHTIMKKCNELSTSEDIVELATKENPVECEVNIKCGSEWHCYRSQGWTPCRVPNDAKMFGPGDFITHNNAIKSALPPVSTPESSQSPQPNLTSTRFQAPPPVPMVVTPPSDNGSPSYDLESLFAGIIESDASPSASTSGLPTPGASPTPKARPFTKYTSRAQETPNRRSSPSRSLHGAGSLFPPPPAPIFRDQAISFGAPAEPRTVACKLKTENVILSDSLRAIPQYTGELNDVVSAPPQPVGWSRKRNSSTFIEGTSDNRVKRRCI